MIGQGNSPEGKSYLEGWINRRRTMRDFLSLPSPLKICPSFPMLLRPKQEVTKNEWLCSRVEASPGHAEKGIHSSWIQSDFPADIPSDPCKGFSSSVGCRNPPVDRSGGGGTPCLGRCGHEAHPMGYSNILSEEWDILKKDTLERASGVCVEMCTRYSPAGEPGFSQGTQRNEHHPRGIWAPTLSPSLLCS